MDHSFLKENYSNWVRSQKMLKDIVENYKTKHITAIKLKAMLENAIMYLLLHEGYKGNDFFEQIDDRHIKEGIRCVGLQNELIAATSDIKNSIHCAKVTDEEIQNLQPVETELYYKVGDYKLIKNKYSQKAFEHVALKHDESTALLSCLTAALRYASIFSETRHIGPPEGVYQLFYRWGVRHEGFASPFNARLLGKENAKFYSLFYDTDALFGSGGSFFNLKEMPDNGHWCLDPPFIEETMQRVDQVIADCKNKGTGFSILYIIPASHQPAITPDETLTLIAGKHYYEGLEGVLKPLPVDVNIHRYGEIKGFSADEVKQAYLPEQPIIGASRKADRYKN